MGTRTRLALLLLIAVLGDRDPIKRPPGLSPQGAIAVAKCPRGHKCDGKPGGLYWCEIDAKWFDPSKNEWAETS
jgi:hypothetical protein